MKKLIVNLILLISCLSTTIVASAEEYRCTATKLNIRNLADKSGKSVGQIEKNETIDILSVDGDWGAILFDGDTCYVSMKYLELVQTDSETSQTVDKPWTDKQKAIFWLCFVVAIGIYAFAIVKVQRGELVVIKGWLDFGLLVFPCVVVLSTIIGAEVILEIMGAYVFATLWIISGLCLIGSLALSVIANWGNPFYVIFSLIMKIIVIPFIALGIFYLISKIADDNGINRKSIIIFAVLGILIGGLMSFKND